MIRIRTRRRIRKTRTRRIRTRTKIRKRRRMETVRRKRRNKDATLQHATVGQFNNNEVITTLAGSRRFLVDLVFC